MTLSSQRSSVVERQIHNLEVAVSITAAATNPGVDSPVVSEAGSSGRVDMPGPSLAAAISLSARGVRSIPSLLRSSESYADAKDRMTPAAVTLPHSRGTTPQRVGFGMPFARSYSARASENVGARCGQSPRRLEIPAR